MDVKHPRQEVINYLVIIVIIVMYLITSSAHFKRERNPDYIAAVYCPYDTLNRK